MKLDMQKFEPLLGTMVNEFGAAANAALALIGDKLGPRGGGCRLRSRRVDRHHGGGVSKIRVHRLRFSRAILS
jgi:hypothetical protein